MIGRLGVCSWSLRPQSAADLAAAVKACGLEAVQLALEPVRPGEGAWGLDETRERLGAAGIDILSGMMATQGEDYSTLETIRRTGGVRPDATWEANRAIAERDADTAAQLGLQLVTLHAGFLPHDPADPERARLVERLRVVADIFAQRGIRVGLETGQETAETLIAVLDELDHPGVGVNFDPANMLLYAMGDPIEALRALAPRVLQVHIKDAKAPTTPGIWGEETPAGEGQVDWPAFFEIVRGLDAPVDTIIEREAGEARVEDVRRAADMLR